MLSTTAGLPILLSENTAIAKLCNFTETQALAAFVEDIFFVEAVDAAEAKEYVDYRNRLADKLRNTVKHAKKAMKILVKRSAEGNLDPNELPSLEEKLVTLREYIEEAETIIDESDDAAGSFGILLMRYVKWYTKTGYLIKNFFAVTGSTLSFGFGIATTLGLAKSTATGIITVGGLTNPIATAIGGLLGLFAGFFMALGEWGSRQDSLEDIKKSSVTIIGKIKSVEDKLTGEINRQKLYQHERYLKTKAKQ